MLLIMNPPHTVSDDSVRDIFIASLNSITLFIVLTYIKP